jgi:hypothetical protein
MPAERCPHCAEPGIFTNVWVTQQSEDLDALERRYQAALVAAVERGCDTVVRDLMAAASRSKAVIARWIDDVERLARGDKQVYATYYQQRRCQARQPDGDPWDALREPTDQALFGEQKEHIRFAALTLDGIGVLNYGDWSLVLRTPMIQRRASTFEDNTAVFMGERKVPLTDIIAAVRGYRASWDDRAKLCVAKLGGAVTPATTPAHFAGLLLMHGPPGKMATDRFVEVHIWGPLTIRTVERVILKKSGDSRRLAKKARIKAIEEQLAKVMVKLEVRP